MASGWLVGCDEPLPKGSAPEHVRDVHEVGDTAGRAGIGRGELGEHSGEMRKRLRWGATGNGLHELLGGPVVVDPVRTQVLVRQRERQVVEGGDDAGALLAESGSAGLGAERPSP